ncbi:hypothetical protein [Celerinatantimonas yamalensis]|uniref:Uncharacterized protein n=1 Tax=Celerinatantimonas yamalensis TaxID=559956 RepID=A0ABW9GBQ9_9GAMM
MLAIKLKFVQWLLDFLLGYQGRLETRRWLKELRSMQYSAPKGLSSHLYQDIGLNLPGEPKAAPTKQPQAAPLRKHQRRTSINARLHLLRWPSTRRRSNIR